MDKHFLADMMSGEPGFRAEPWYNPPGDCIIYLMANEATVAQRIDELLTVYNSALDDRPIGFQIKGVTAITRKLGIDGLVIRSEADTGGVKSISITALLLAAYEEGPRTLRRRKAYAAAVDTADRRTLPTDELEPQPA